jgi:hypothetical protein
VKGLHKVRGSGKRNLKIDEKRFGEFRRRLGESMGSGKIIVFLRFP